MQAPETIEIVEASETRVRGACLITGCPCKDSRIVSYRRAAFFAAVARGSGQTADRVVAVEPEWRIPLVSLTDRSFRLGIGRTSSNYLTVDLHPRASSRR